MLNILLPLALDAPYSYVFTHPLLRGTWVRVPLQNRVIEGIVWGESEGTLLKPLKLKAIEAVLALPALSSQLCDFIVCFPLKHCSKKRLKLACGAPRFPHNGSHPNVRACWPAYRKVSGLKAN
jgi:primosomal protein N'